MSALRESCDQAGRNNVNNMDAKGVRHTRGPIEASLTDSEVARDSERATREVEHLFQTLMRQRSFSQTCPCNGDEHVRSRVYPSTPLYTQVDHTRGRGTATTGHIQLS